MLAPRITPDKVGPGLARCRVLQRRASLRVAPDEIEELRLEGGDESDAVSRPRLFLKTLGRELYLASLGEWLAGQKLVQDLQAMVSSWKRNSR